VSAPTLAEALFRPRAVALIGISDDAGKTAGRPLPFLRKHGFQGRIFPVNPHRTTVQGEPALKSLADATEPIDHAYILVNTPAVEDAVRACADARVRVATILASGFAETGADGVARQQRLVAIARGSGLRLVGPNSLGVVDTHTPMALTANAAFAAEALLRGGLTVISQSGSQIGTFVSRGAARGIGFAKLISVGNEADLSVGEIGTALAEDPETKAFLLFLETIRDPHHIAEFAARAGRAGKPVIAYKLGRSEVGRELAVSHTGAMIGSDAAAEAFLRRHGILRVDHLETLFEMAPLAVGRTASSRPRSVGVVTTTGGGAAMVVDRLGMLGVEVAAPSAETLARLNTAGVPAQPGRLLDLTLAGTRYEVMRAALDTLLESPEFGLVLAVVGSSAQFHPDLAVRPIIDCAHHRKPIAVFLTPEAPRTLQLLAEHGVAAFRTPEACADGISAYFGWQMAHRPPSRDEAALRSASHVLDAASGDILNEDRSLALFEALGIPTAARVVSPIGAERIETPPFPFPVVAKILSADITHKSDLGGVALGIASSEELARKAREMIAAVTTAKPGARLDGVLVQPMERGVGEIILGYRLDPQLGPLVMVGMGGTLAELYHDVALRIAPVSSAEAAEMILELKGIAALQGFRGRPAGDLDALAEAVMRMSGLANLPGARIIEAEINPLIVRPRGAGVVAVDGVVRRADQQFAPTTALGLGDRAHRG
jgi:acyl-CoA synthetase (NDP forming)